MDQQVVSAVCSTSIYEKHAKQQSIVATLRVLQTKCHVDVAYENNAALKLLLYGFADGKEYALVYHAIEYLLDYIQSESDTAVNVIQTLDGKHG
eukprot:CAMPEP_0202715648 /NCGR_PEP_ID=MMETSP1385-20130828/92535_1 /ASSEMBLY_ACC=CAM_ASM_000861 /TAXON_ID=933848 /ORGANISM="Elphidium margaritaceum" /LENGTH=93 /DNA_ID=CAMNT_0049377015 /DNA_START=192 /DNA_END=469 /DNA_ORIENTATION=+